MHPTAIRLGRRGLLPALLAFAGLAAPAAAQVQYSTVALSGQSAPGLSGLKFGTLADPRLSDTFSVAFWSQLTSGVAINLDNAFWVDRGSGPILAARENDAFPAPGIFGILTPQLSSAGLLSYTFAQIQSPVGPIRAAFAAQSSPGAPLAIVDSEPPQTASAGQTLSVPIPRSDSGQSAYLLSASAPNPAVLHTPSGVITEGDPAPIAGTSLPAGALFRRFSPPVMNASGDIVFRAWAGDLPDAATWRQGLWKLRAGTNTPVAIVAQGDLSPDVGYVYRDFGPTPQIDMDGRVAFQSLLVFNTSANVTGLYRADDAGTTRLILTGHAIAGTGPHAANVGARFAATPTGELCVLVPLQDGGAAANALLLRIAPDNTQSIVIREGDPAPGLAGATIATLLEPRLSGSGGVAFLASVQSGGVRKSTLFAAARVGSSVYPIASIGETFTPPGGVAKVVRDLSFDHEQQPSGLSQFVGRSLVFTLSFVDESNAILRADLPAPEPVADVNLDGQLTLDDFFAFFSAWDTSLPPADLDGVQGVTLEDFFAFFSSWDG